MRKRIILVLFALIIFACSLPQNYNSIIPEIKSGEKLKDGISKISDDKTYGYDSQNPIQVGGGVRNEYYYLNMLQGPKGEELNFFRVGSFSGPNVMVDGYQISYQGIVDTLLIFIDMYNYNDPLAPMGLTIKPEFQK